MGNTQPEFNTSLTHSSAKLNVVFKITFEEEDGIKQIIASRSNMKNQYICSPNKYFFSEEGATNAFCQTFKQVIISYDNFDFYLDDLWKYFPLAQHEVESILFSVCSALIYFEQHKIHHGDISTKMICKVQNTWKLIDNCFIKGGVSAYEKILSGEEGFISPYQMQKIRHGFIRESPAISEADDVFALGMTCLEIMSGKPSKNCYKQSFIRFNLHQIEVNSESIRKIYSAQLCNLVFGMISFDEGSRISVRNIIDRPIIYRHSRKYSLANGYR